MARTFGFFQTPPSEASTELGMKKGHMQRKAQNRLWTLILMLLLCGAGMSATRVARAGVAPSDPVPGGPPGDPQAGDPDAPGGGKSMPKPGVGRGVAAPTSYRDARQSNFGMWMLRLRMAFASFYRTLFRF